MALYSTTKPTTTPSIIGKIKDTLVGRFRKTLSDAKNMAGNAVNTVGRSIDPAWGLTSDQIKQVNKKMGDRTGLSPAEQSKTLRAAIDAIRNGK